MQQRNAGYCNHEIVIGQCGLCNSKKPKRTVTTRPTPVQASVTPKQVKDALQELSNDLAVFVICHKDILTNPSEQTIKSESVELKILCQDLEKIEDRARKTRESFLTTLNPRA